MRVGHDISNWFSEVDITQLEEWEGPETESTARLNQALLLDAGKGRDGESVLPKQSLYLDFLLMKEPTF